MPVLDYYLWLPILTSALPEYPGDPWQSLQSYEAVLAGTMAFDLAFSLVFVWGLISMGLIWIFRCVSRS